MNNQHIYTDPLGNKLCFEDGVYVVEYRANAEGIIHVEELPFQQGTLASDVNGVSNELLLEAIIHRLQRLDEKDSSVFNKLTILLLKSAQELLSDKSKHQEFRASLGEDKLNDSDQNALVVMRWRSIVRGIEHTTRGMKDILDGTYKKNRQLRSVDIKRLKHPKIIEVFSKES